MEDKKDVTPDDLTASKPNPQVDLLDNEPVVAAVESNPEPTAAASVTPKRKSWQFTAIAIVLVVVALLAVLFRLEKEGRVSTNLFGAIIEQQEANRTVVEVNGNKVRAEQLRATIDQLIQTAGAQGLNPSDPAVQSEIQSQAMDMVVNTELLTQQAAELGITAAQDDIDARIAEIETAAGGAESLMERLAEFDIDREELVSDVESEILIQSLLEDQVFADIADVTEDDIAEVYNGAVQNAQGQELPPLDQVSAQIEQQILQTRQQEALDQYLAELRADADIDIK